MHRFIWKRLSVTLIERSKASSPTSQISSSLQNLRLLSSISTTSDDTDSDNCANQKPSADRPSSVLKFFQDCGFSQIQTQSIVSRYPQFLRSDDPEKTFKPKISFFHSIGISEADVAKMVTLSPLVLYRSLNNHLIPTFDLLKKFMGGEVKAISLLKRCPFILRRNIADTLPVNMSTLRNHGVPESNILKMLSYKLTNETMEASQPDWFSKVVECVVKMGFDPSSASFACAVSAMGLCNESTWEEKIKFYQGLGFSREEFFSMFKKQPISVSLPQKKVREAVEFYHDKLHWGPSELAMRPTLLMYSLHKRVIPRCSVLQFLWSRHMINKTLLLPTVLHRTEKEFLETYVTKYQVELPQVLDAYQGKLRFDEFTFVSGRNYEPKGCLKLI